MAAGIMACNADPEWRERILRGMTLVALFDGEPGPEALELLDRTARSFQVNASPVRSYRNELRARCGTRHLAGWGATDAGRHLEGGERTP